MSTTAANPRLSNRNLLGHCFHQRYASSEVALLVHVLDHDSFLWPPSRRVAGIHYQGLTTLHHQFRTSACTHLATACATNDSLLRLLSSLLLSVGFTAESWIRLQGAWRSTAAQSCKSSRKQSSLVTADCGNWGPRVLEPNAFALSKLCPLYNCPSCCCHVCDR